MKRILNCCTSDFNAQPGAEELFAAMKASEGRTLLAEVAADTVPLYPDVTNAELVSAFGADLILLKGYNTEAHSVAGAPGEGGYKHIKLLTGRLVGVSLEVVGNPDIENPRCLTQKTLERVRDADFLCLTGYDKPDVDKQTMLEAIKLAQAYFPGFLMVAKFYAKGLAEAAEYAEYISAGAHAAVIPAPGSCPGSREEVVSRAVDAVHRAGGLAMTTISSSQEGADPETVKLIGLASKRCGSDVHNFGDAGCAGIAAPEAIQALSIAIRGKRHTYVRMASSILR
ncbi:hypothetical protein MUA02_16650 [Enterobacteriaceae bacterium H20N1]|uniref:DUF7916 domain-containing protein n=1 Tax=Dryocola boscaweniae TaxID=2925397 RepID=A0A9X2WA56_9ENTR|nr:hypothetical protein [Dryocola boscaweniae]MCT4703487.1 hypothetical protein [Dryocola boscaweniae]MCT4720655.1 hypothetical protein [Dryocola boscaweniae]